MKVKLVQCGICEHWHMPSAHHNHCPACGTICITVRGSRFYYNILNARAVARTGMSRALLNLLNPQSRTIRVNPETV